MNVLYIFKILASSHQSLCYCRFSKKWKSFQINNTRQRDTNKYWLCISAILDWDSVEARPDFTLINGAICFCVCRVKYAEQDKALCRLGRLSCWNWFEFNTWQWQCFWQPRQEWKASGFRKQHILNAHNITPPTVRKSHRKYRRLQTFRRLIGKLKMTSIKSQPKQSTLQIKKSFRNALDSFLILYSYYCISSGFNLQFISFIWSFSLMNLAGTMSENLMSHAYESII